MGLVAVAAACSRPAEPGGTGRTGETARRRAHVQPRYRSDPLRQLRELPSPGRWRRAAAGGDLTGSADDPICVAGAPFSVLDYDSVRRHARGDRVGRAAPRDAAVAARARTRRVRRRTAAPRRSDRAHREMGRERRARGQSGRRAEAADVLRRLAARHARSRADAAGAVRAAAREPRRLPQLRHSGADHHDPLRARRRVPRRSSAGAAPCGPGDRCRRASRARSIAPTRVPDSRRWTAIRCRTCTAGRRARCR